MAALLATGRKVADCGGDHDYNGKRDMGRYDVYTLPSGERYAVCAHKVGERGYCGALVDASERVTICCGDHA